ncbi:MAG: hypothetical protein ABSF57_07555, partial [Acidobacteriaceae bacterium]
AETSKSPARINNPLWMSAACFCRHPDPERSEGEGPLYLFWSSFVLIVILSCGAHSRIVIAAVEGPAIACFACHSERSEESPHWFCRLPHPPHSSRYKWQPRPKFACQTPNH